MATKGAATNTPNTPKAATQRSIEKITATGCTFMPRAMMKGENHIVLQGLNHNIR
jgi:hypothetical protein